MTKTLWAAVVKEPEQGKYIASAYSFDKYLNMVHVVKGYTIFNLCENKKQAVALSDYWNECYKNNGTYALDKSQTGIEYISKHETDIRSAIYDFLVETLGETECRKNLYMYRTDGKPEFRVLSKSDSNSSIDDKGILVCFHEPDINGDEAEMMAFDDDKDGWIDEAAIEYWMDELKKAMEKE